MSCMLPFNLYHPNVLWGGGAKTNGADPDQTPHAVSDQDFRCLLTECSIKIWKNEKYHPTSLDLKRARPVDKGRQVYST